MAQFLAQTNGAAQRHMPGTHGVDQRLTHGADVVLELNGTADVDTAGVELNGGALHPVIKQRTQTRQAARCLHGGQEHLLLKTLVVFADHGNLQLFARTKMRKNA